MPVLRSGDTIQITVETERPATTTLRAGVEFTQHNKHYRSTLPDLHIEISDLLCPLPLNNFCPHLLFSRLWDHCLDNQNREGKGDAFVSKIRPAEGFRIKLNPFKLPETKERRRVFTCSLFLQDTLFSSCVFLSSLLYKLLLIHGKCFLLSINC